MPHNVGAFTMWRHRIPIAWIKINSSIGKHKLNEILSSPYRKCYVIRMPGSAWSETRSRIMLQLGKYDCCSADVSVVSIG